MISCKYCESPATVMMSSFPLRISLKVLEKLVATLC